jgi:hypothetical protein
MKLENFEKEYMQEIETLKKVEFSPVLHKDFRFPAYNFFYTKALSIAFAVPAVVAVAAFFFTLTPDTNSQNLALLEESNNRIIEQINNLDHENGF